MSKPETQHQVEEVLRALAREIQQRAERERAIGRLIRELTRR